MYRVTALPIKQRIDISRQGKRVRRLPSIVVSGGASIKLSPGQAMHISEATYRENARLFYDQRDMLQVELVTITKPEEARSGKLLSEDPTMPVFLPPEVPKPVQPEPAEIPKLAAPSPLEVPEPTEATIEKGDEVTRPEKEAPKRRGRPKKSSTEVATRKRRSKKKEEVGV